MVSIVNRLLGNRRRVAFAARVSEFRLPGGSSHLDFLRFFSWIDFEERSV